MNNTVSIPRPEHPEPIKRRDAWQNLNGEWGFYNDHGIGYREAQLIKPGFMEGFPQKITVPFCPESKLSGIENKDFMRSVWYKRSFSVTEEQLCGRVIIHFGAVDYESILFINGKEVGSHFGGYSSFEFDITDYLTVGENDVTLHAKDTMQNIPVGKQCHDYYEPYGCLYTRTTGIWQTVWLEFVANGYIKSLRYYPDIEEAAFDIDLMLSMPGKVTVEAFYEGKPVGKAERSANGLYTRLRLQLSEKHLWELGCGRLYDFKFTFETEGGTDILYSYAGLREVAINGFKVLINGKSVFQRTVLDQGYYPDGIYTAPSDEALKKDIELSMKLGFNGARLHEKIFEPRYLYHCDKAGYLVWGEHANWRLDADSDAGLLNFLPEWSEAVERDFNHPAIIGWCPFNETWGQSGKTAERTISAVYKETKRMDPTRPVIDSSGFRHIVTDIFDQHDYEQDVEAFRKGYTCYDGSKESFKYIEYEGQCFAPNSPFFVSEFGGTFWNTADKAIKSDNDFVYGVSKEEDEFFSRYEGLTAALLDAPCIMGFCYTQLYDVEQEVNGFYTYERKPKFSDFSRIIAANTRKAAIEE